MGKSEILNEEEDEEDEEEFIDIPVRDENGEESEQVIGIPIHSLPSLDSVLGILTREEASLDKWVIVAVEYYRQGHLAEFETLVNIGCSEDVEERYADDKKGRLQILNTLAAYKITQDGLDSSCGVTRLSSMRKTSEKPPGEHLAEALDLLTRSDDLDDRESFTWVNKGILSLVQGQNDSALQNFDRALGNDSKNLSAKLGKGFVLFRKRQFAAARDQYKRIMREHPGCSPNVRVNLGLCYYELGIESRAAECFERALELDDEEPNAHVALAMIEFSRAQRDGFNSEMMKRGMKRIRQVYELQPNNATVLTHLANHFFFKKDSGSREYSRIESLARKAYRNTHLLPIKAEAAYILGRNFHEQGDLDSAKQFYDRALQHWNEFPLAQFAKAQMLLAQSESMGMTLSKNESDQARNEALQLFDKILHIKDFREDRDVSMCVAWIYIRTNRRRLAKALLKRMTIADPGDTEAWLELCRVMQKERQVTKKQKRESIRAYTKAASGMSSIPSFIFTNVGELKFSLGDIRGALEVFREGLELGSQGQRTISPEDRVTLRFDLARVLEEVGGIDEAESIYKTLNAELPNYTEPLLRLGYIAERHGKLSEAENLYTKAAMTKTDPEDAWCFLGFLAQKRGNIKRAKECFSQIRKGDNNRIDAYAKISLANIAFDSVRGQKKMNLTDFKEAVDYAKRWYVKVLERNSSNLYAATGLANGLAAEDYLAEAKQILEHLREPDDVVSHSVWINLGHIAMENERFEMAVSLYQQSIKRFGLEDDIELLICLASALVCTDKYPEARSVLLRAIKIDPSDLRLRYNLGMLMLKHGGHYCDGKEEKRTLKGVIHAVSGFEDAKKIFEWLAKTRGHNDTFPSINSKHFTLNDPNPDPIDSSNIKSGQFFQEPRRPVGEPTSKNKDYFKRIIEARKCKQESHDQPISTSDTLTGGITTETMRSEVEDDPQNMRSLVVRAPRSDSFKHAHAAAQLVERAKVYISKSEKFLIDEHHNEQEKELALNKLREENMKLEMEQEVARLQREEALENIRKDEDRRAQELSIRSRKIVAELVELNERKLREKDKKDSKASRSERKRNKKQNEGDDIVVDDDDEADAAILFDSDDSGNNRDSENEADFDPNAVNKRRKESVANNGSSSEDESEVSDTETTEDEGSEGINAGSDKGQDNKDVKIKRKRKRKRNTKSKHENGGKKNRTLEKSPSIKTKRKLVKRGEAEDVDKSAKTVSNELHVKVEEGHGTTNTPGPNKKKVMIDSDDDEELEF